MGRTAPDGDHHHVVASCGCPTRGFAGQPFAEAGLDGTECRVESSMWVIHPARAQPPPQPQGGEQRPVGGLESDALVAELPLLHAELVAQ
jgi:hypothetical protein